MAVDSDWPKDNSVRPAGCCKATFIRMAQIMKVKKKVRKCTHNVSIGELSLF